MEIELFQYLQMHQTEIKSAYIMGICMFYGSIIFGCLAILYLAAMTTNIGIYYSAKSQLRKENVAEEVLIKKRQEVKNAKLNFIVFVISLIGMIWVSVGMFKVSMMQDEYIDEYQEKYATYFDLLDNQLIQSLKDKEAIAISTVVSQNSLEHGEISNIQLVGKDGTVYNGRTKVLITKELEKDSLFIIDELPEKYRAILEEDEFNYILVLHKEKTSEFK